MTSFHFYEPKDGHGLAHNPFKAIIAPRPIGWVSSQSASGNVNLAPYSFFNAFSDTPPLLGFASNGWKDSARNIAETGEFCWHLASRELAAQMSISSAPVAPDVDEFALAGLTPAPSRVVSVPHVAEALAVFECQLTDFVHLHDRSGAEVPTWLVCGEVVGVHIHTSLIVDDTVQTILADPISRAGGRDGYFGVSEDTYISLPRPPIPE